MQVSSAYFAPDLSWGGHFPDQFLRAFLLGLAVRRLVRSTGASDGPHHMGMDTRCGRRSLLRLLARGGIKTRCVSVHSVRRFLPLLEARAVKQLGRVSPRCHLSLPARWRRLACVWAGEEMEHVAAQWGWHPQNIKLPSTSPPASPMFTPGARSPSWGRRPPNPLR